MQPRAQAVRQALEQRRRRDLAGRHLVVAGVKSIGDLPGTKLRKKGVPVDDGRW